MIDQIDFVVTWVDGADPVWQKERALFCPPNLDNGSSLNRYRDWGLMKYWFRGVEKYAPWVHRIFFITNGQVPEWLNTEHPKLRMVRHDDYIPRQYLPTFNANVIELRIHRIPELSEHFVLCNDDTFITAPVCVEDFFENGIPCESALMDIVTALDPEDCFPHILINNFAVINKYFNKKEVLRKNAGKFFTFKYGKDVMRNIFLLPFQNFSCFRDPHLPASLLKSTFEHVWELEGELLEGCGQNRFRSKSDLTQWLMKSWQICEGNFIARSTKWGHHFELWEDSTEGICRSIEKQKYRTICLNDSKVEIEFEKIQRRLSGSFELILPEPSEYEKKS